MDIVLIQDIRTLGHAGDVKSVKRGYAINFLIPQGFALPAKPGFIKEAQARTRKIQRQREARLDEMQGIIEKLNGVRIEIEKKASKEGKLFGSVKKHDIALALKNHVDRIIDDEYIMLDEPIKKIGEHQVSVRAAGDLTATVQVKVVSEDSNSK